MNPIKQLRRLMDGMSDDERYVPKTDPRYHTSAPYSDRFEGFARRLHHLRRAAGLRHKTSIQAHRNRSLR